MNRIILFLAVALSSFATAQERIYIDLYGNPVEKEKAELYRIISQKNGLYHIKDYYLDGTLQMDAFSKKDNISELEDIEGKYTFYHKNGKIETIGEIRNGKKVKEAKGFDETGRMTYHEKIDKDGLSDIKYIAYQNEYNESDYMLLVNKDETSTRIIYDKDITKIRYEVFHQDEKSVTKYYDLKGKLIGTLIYDDDHTPKGTEVTYYYQPMRVKSITKYDDGRIASQETYYPNGKIFSKEEKNVVFYDNSGKKMGELEYKEDEDGLKNYHQGTFFELNEKGILSEKTEYKLGFLVSSSEFYDNGVEKSKIKYDLDQLPERVTFYSSDGKEKSFLNYVEGQPYQGIFYNDLQKNDAHTMYENGKMTSQVNYDQNRVLRYKKTLKNSEEEEYFCEIFDEKGNKTYQYTSKNWGNDLNITQFENGKQVAEAIVEAGIITQGSISYQQNIGDKKILVYIENKGEWIISQTQFNGELVKEFRVNQEYAKEDYSSDIRIGESLFSEYTDMNSSY